MKKKGDSAKAAVRDGSGDKSAPRAVLQGSTVFHRESQKFINRRVRVCTDLPRDPAVDRNYEFHLIFPALSASRPSSHSHPVYISCSPPLSVSLVVPSSRSDDLWQP